MVERKLCSHPIDIHRHTIIEEMFRIAFEEAVSRYGVQILGSESGHGIYGASVIDPSKTSRGAEFVGCACCLYPSQLWPRFYCRFGGRKYFLEEELELLKYRAVVEDCQVEEWWIKVRICILLLVKVIEKKPNVRRCETNSQSWR
jgi:hypothetical protein